MKDKIIAKQDQLIETLTKLIKYYESFNTINSIKTDTLKAYIKTYESELSSLKAEAQEKNYELQYCEVCVQMTNHLQGICQKHKAQEVSDADIEKYFTSQHYDNKNGHHYRLKKDRIFGAKAMRDGKIKPNE